MITYAWLKVEKSQPKTEPEQGFKAVVPAGFVSFVPLQLLHQFSWLLLGSLVGFTTLIVAIAAGLFHLGLRRYESGNLMGMQV